MVAISPIGPEMTGIDVSTALVCISGFVAAMAPDVCR